MSRVAVDMLGGDGAPEVVADALALLNASEGSESIDLLLVGPVNVVGELLIDRGIAVDRWPTVDAQGAVLMDGDPLALRSQTSLSAAVAACAVRDGLADAWVSAGHTGASVAAGVLHLGRMTGMSRPALAVVLPATHGPVVLVDAGASLEATSQVLLEFALAGWCYARALDIEFPHVGLLSIGSEPGKGDALRSQTDHLLRTQLPDFGIAYSGTVEGQDVSDGRRAQVIVTDGFTGNVVLKAIEGAVSWTAMHLAQAYQDSGPARQLVRQTLTSDFAGGMLLGVNGVSVVGHGASRPAEIAACIKLAARVADHDIVAQTQSVFTLMAARP